MESFRDPCTIKKGYRRRVGISFFVLFFLLSGGLYGENIRGRVQHFIEIPGSYGKVSGEVGLRSPAAVDFASGEFIRGIIIEVVSPPSVLQFRQSFLLTLYGNVSPDPDSDSENFTGRKLFSLPFPTAKKTYIDLPLESFSGWETSTPGSIELESPLKSEDFPLLLAIDPVMKGIPSSVASSEFSVALTPVLKNLGALQLDLPSDADTDALYFLIDGKDIDDPGTKQYLKPGVHTLEVKSDSYLPIRQTVGIEKAVTARINIDLQPARSFVQFHAPEGAAVFFDGEVVNIGSEDRVETDPGDHVVLVRIGDYSVSKKIAVQGGKTYKVSLFFDILIDDN